MTAKTKTAKTTKTSAKTSARKAPSKASTAAARGKKIVFVAPQPRREGTKAAKLYAAMAKFVGKKKVDVETVLEKTGYRRVDLNWDVARGNVKIA